MGGWPPFRESYDHRSNATAGDEQAVEQNRKICCEDSHCGVELLIVEVAKFYAPGNRQMT